LGKSIPAQLIRKIKSIGEFPNQANRNILRIDNILERIEMEFPHTREAGDFMQEREREERAGDERARENLERGGEAREKEESSELLGGRVGPKKTAQNFVTIEELRTRNEHSRLPALPRVHTHHTIEKRTSALMHRTWWERKKKEREREGEREGRRKSRERESRERERERCPPVEVEWSGTMGVEEEDREPLRGDGLPPLWSLRTFRLRRMRERQWESKWRPQS
jgi:hypothetical protein